MPVDIDVHIDDLADSSHLSVSDLTKATRLALERQEVSDATVAIILTGHSTVRELNEQYLDHHYNTDVLSFILSANDEPLDGEVYVDVETAAERCDEFNATLKDEVARYVIHGVLHLTGLDDSTEQEKEYMTSLEDEILTALTEDL